MRGNKGVICSATDDLNKQVIKLPKMDSFKWYCVSWKRKPSELSVTQVRETGAWLPAVYLQPCLLCLQYHCLNFEKRTP